MSAPHRRTPQRPLTAAQAVEQARELHARGLDAGHAGRETTEHRLLLRALKILESAVSADPEWVRTWIRLQVTLAFVEAELGKTGDGIARLDAIRPQVLALEDEPIRSELNGFVDGNHAGILVRAGQYDESIPLFESARAHKERALRMGTEDPRQMTDSLVGTITNLGLAYVELGRVDPAIRNLTRAIRLGQNHGFAMKLAYAKHVLGDLRLRTGDVPAALRCYEEAERTYLEIGPDMLGRLRIDQGQALLTAGLADEAGRGLDEVLPQMREQRVQQDLAEAEAVRATAALLEDDLGLARRLAASARRRFKRRGSDAWAALAALIELRVDVARAFTEKKVPAKLPARAVAMAAELTEFRLFDEAALAQTLAVRLELRRDNVDRANELLRGLRKPGPLTTIDQRMLVRLSRAELAVAEGNRRKAFAQALAGLAELGQARDRMGGLELLSGTAIHGQELGDLAVRLVLDGGDSPAEARRMFGWLERTRAQMYRYEPVSRADDPELVEVIAAIRHLGHTLRQARLDGRPVGKLQARYAERKRAAMRLGWHAASRWGKPRPVADVDDVSADLGEGVLISFAVSGDSLLAVVLVDGAVRLIPLGSSSHAIENARRLHADLTAIAPDVLSQPLFEAVSASARKHANALDAQLLQPLSRIIADRDVVIIPTGALHAVPWGVLGSLRSRPVVVAPSATAWLGAVRSKPRANGGTVLVRGPGLSAAVGEIDKLAAHHDNAILLADNEADVASVMIALDGAELAHIAAHGEHEADNALFSRLELIDGALFAHELSRLQHPPRQVVLAACELALSRIRPGDEALGFAGALLAGGVDTVVAAASKVGDLPAAAAMDDYHRALASGATPAVALADAVAVDPFRRPFVCLGSGTGQRGMA
ncbi:CHAT domain-containing tetratricopeptide repeat protein [Actinocrispum sp. NPDC049592]|uniref:CHAT domain-containing protein n=1 Tax=Actinocrispum sp. NPDC049592 TaxID=3154835 RepID=UPI00342F0B41